MTNTNEDIPMWMQQKGEQAKSFYYFTVYRDLGAYRTLEKVIPEIKCRAKKDKEDRGTLDENETFDIPAFGTLGALSSKWHWVDRCRAWDEHLDSMARTEQELKVKEMAERHALNSEKLQKQILKLTDDEEFKELTPTQKAWVLNSNTHSYSKLALLERLSRGEPPEQPINNKSGLSEFARTIEDSIKKAKGPK